jgi:hypothetical protein
VCPWLEFSLVSLFSLLCFTYSPYFIIFSHMCCLKCSSLVQSSSLFCSHSLSYILSLSFSILIYFLAFISSLLLAGSWISWKRFSIVISQLLRSYLECKLLILLWAGWWCDSTLRFAFVRYSVLISARLLALLRFFMDFLSLSK